VKRSGTTKGEKMKRSQVIEVRVNAFNIAFTRKLWIGNRLITVRVPHFSVTDSSFNRVKTVLANVLGTLTIQEPENGYSGGWTYKIERRDNGNDET
jgi:hypothetical protein